MNEKVKIITDSGCDITRESEKEWAKYLTIIPFVVTVQGKEYLDRIDVKEDEFYKILKEQEEIPKHSQITQLQFEEKYRELYEEGIREIIVDVINAEGSQTYSQSVLAAQNIHDEFPDLKIHNVDSKNYSIHYGYPIIEACKKLSEGQSVESVVAYLHDWADHSESFIVGFGLRHMKKSGRISAAASFLGELMGLKPLIMLHAGTTAVLKKARGEKAVIDAAVETISSRIIPKTPYCVITTTRPELEKELIEKLTKKLGYAPAYVSKCGVVVSCNAGPEFIGVFIKSKDHSLN
ncbi:MAG: DegV family protein [Oscillospiraceae bacterium]|nr:DegV family protein [Oscillospiraceae bacterium]